VGEEDEDVLGAAPVAATAGVEAAPAFAPASVGEPIEPEEPQPLDAPAAAAPWTEPSEAVPAGRPAEVDLTSKTLGELYLQQGHLERALEIFERYLVSNPADTQARERVAEIRAQLAPVAAAAPAPPREVVAPVAPPSLVPAPARAPAPVATPPPAHAPAPPPAQSPVPPPAPPPAQAPAPPARQAPAPATMAEEKEPGDEKDQKIQKLSRWLASLKKT
jgi:hypothetical protein